MSGNPAGSWLFRWGMLVARFRWMVLIIPLLGGLACVPAAARVTDHLTAGGWIPEGSESRRVDHLLKDEFGRSSSGNYLLFSDPTGRLMATDPEFRREVERIVASFRTDSGVASVYTWGTTTNSDLNRILISDDRTSSIAAISLVRNTAQSPEQSFSQFSDRVHSDLLDVQIGGWPATTSALQRLTSDDLGRAEKIAVPVTLLLLILVYGGIIAAALPIALATCAIIVSLGTLSLISGIVDSSTFAVNTVTMLGLAVGIDYGLMLITRFRDELQKHDPETALARALSTAGRAILISGLAVAVGLVGLLLFAVPAAISTGISGAVVVIVSVLLALTSLPAALLILQRQVGKRGMSPISARVTTPTLFTRGLHVTLSALQRRPGLAIIVCLLLLGFLSTPILSLRPGSPTMTILPPTSEARVVYDTVASDFSNASLSPITVVVQPKQGRMTSSTNLDAFRSTTSAIAALPGVNAVESLWSFVPNGAGPLAVSTSLTLDSNLQQATRSYVTPRAALIQIELDGTLDTDAQEQLVQLLRSESSQLSSGSFTMSVGGEAASSVDLLATVSERSPGVIGFMVIATWIILFLQFQSVLLPLKAIALNLLSLAAAFGVSIWVFQQGNLSSLLQFEPAEHTVVILPILMFCFMFGLSMDFEVLMLSRIREVWLETGDNDRAVREGLRHSARIVTSAAAVMLVVFAAFGTSDLLLIKALGLGLGLAVLIDATIIRLVLLPATMQVMGTWNWWRPSFLDRSDRLHRDLLGVPPPPEEHPNS